MLPSEDSVAASKLTSGSMIDSTVSLPAPRNVTPVEVESVLSLHESVAEVVVAGLPDERWGQKICAFVRRSGPVDGAALDAFCRQSDLANFKRPRQYIFVREVPKSPTGKILRRMLVAGEYKTDG